MKGHDDVVELLNDVLTAELTAINQYFLDAKMYDNWGYERLGKKFRDESIAEMKDADELIERILYLEGMPNLQRLGPVRVGETPVEKLPLLGERANDGGGQEENGKDHRRSGLGRPSLGRTQGRHRAGPTVSDGGLPGPLASSRTRACGDGCSGGCPWP